MYRVPSGPLNKFLYILGWEHRLWRDKDHQLMSATAVAVRTGLAIGYLGCILSAISVIVVIERAFLESWQVWLAILLVILWWASVWFAIGVYLSRLGRAARMLLPQPRD
jgi:hypothetical protein